MYICFDVLPITADWSISYYLKAKIDPVCNCTHSFVVTIDANLACIANCNVCTIQHFCWEFAVVVDAEGKGAR